MIEDLRRCITSEGMGIKENDIKMRKMYNDFVENRFWEVVDKGWEEYQVDVKNGEEGE